LAVSEKNDSRKRGQRAGSFAMWAAGSYAAKATANVRERIAFVLDGMSAHLARPLLIVGIPMVLAPLWTVSATVAPAFLWPVFRFPSRTPSPRAAVPFFWFWRHGSC